MLVYDDTAAAALHAAADEARLSDAAGYETAHILLGLLRTADSVTQAVTTQHPRLTVDAVRVALGDPPRQPSSEHGGTVRNGRSRPEPAGEFRRAARQFTAKWRALVRDRQLQAGPKLGVGELWLTVLEPDTRSARALAAVGVKPDDVRRVVLAEMVPDGAPVPDWPTAVPAGAVRRLLGSVRASAGGGGRSN